MTRARVEKRYREIEARAAMSHRQTKLEALRSGATNFSIPTLRIRTINSTETKPLTTSTTYNEKNYRSQRETSPTTTTTKSLTMIQESQDRTYD
ncbi:hypothetical protein AALP_AA4G122400 [Arabis alpina]|uniref:Uncharacterized protein n=1 Tax=Arabis alpina TaxID=50452 RepID=A0A087H2S1_ARAAL|nr:hypothetical protein AALP_AA4G122400 [Arabis alpina]